MRFPAFQGSPQQLQKSSKLQVRSSSTSFFYISIYPKLLNKNETNPTIQTKPHIPNRNCLASICPKQLRQTPTLLSQHPQDQTQVPHCPFLQDKLHQPHCAHLNSILSFSMMTTTTCCLLLSQHNPMAPLLTHPHTVLKHI